MEVVCERESNDGKTGIVTRTRIILILLGLALDILQITLLTVDIGNATIPASVLECSTQQTRVGQCVSHDVTVSGEAEVNQIVVLRNDLCT